MQEVWHPSASGCPVRLIALLFLTIVEFAREPPHGPALLYHQPLRSGYFILEPLEPGGAFNTFLDRPKALLVVLKMR